VFAGFDPREAIGFHVFASSLFRHTERPVSLTPLSGKQRDGTNAFTYARFQVPRLCDYEGWAIFVDGSDMLCRDDIAKLWDLRDPKYAVQVVKHAYQTGADRKYRGTVLEAKNEDYPRKNWSSVILWNCGHEAHRRIDERDGGSFLHRFSWLPDDLIGGLPPSWNVLVGEQDTEAQIAHFTLGLPSFPQYADCRYADEWRRELQRVAQCGTT
jgi:hypothetical protein